MHHPTILIALDNFARHCRIYFIDPEDKEFKETIKNALTKMETPMDPSQISCVIKMELFHVTGTSGSRCISLILLHARIRRRIRLCHFCTHIDIVTEIAIVSFRALPVGFPLPTISKNSLYTLFIPLILDHGVSFIISVSGAKIPIS